MQTIGHSTWKDAGVDASVHDALAAQLTGSALRSLLLSVAQRRAMARGPSDVLQQFEQDRFVGIAPVDQRTLRRLELTLLEVADAYDAVELSPVAPLGTCAAVAPGSQNRIVSTMRGTEVVSDPTNVLALECARRLRADPAATVRLATTHRCVRAQSVPAGRGMAAHFSMFCLATAGHEARGAWAAAPRNGADRSAAPRARDWSDFVIPEDSGTGAPVARGCEPAGAL